MTGRTEREGTGMRIQEPATGEIAPGIERGERKGIRIDHTVAARDHQSRETDDRAPEKDRSEETETETETNMEIGTEEAGGKGVERETAESVGRDQDLQRPGRRVAIESTMKAWEEMTEISEGDTAQTTSRECDATRTKAALNQTTDEVSSNGTALYLLRMTPSQLVMARNPPSR